jgi:putative ABC transport system permease protein
MKLLARVRSFVAALVRGDRLEHEMDEEWQFHLEARAETLMREGVSPEAAARRARAEFGDPLRWKEGGREARGVIWIYDLIADLRYGLRQLRRSPVFAATAVVTLALGIGANTLAFSILNAVLVKELPYPDPDRIVLVNFGPSDKPDARIGATLQNYFAVRDRSTSFEFVGSASGVMASIAVSADDEAGGEPVPGQRIHATLPKVLGVQPLIGTWFTEADDPAAAPLKVVLSHALWQQRFGGDRDAVGRMVRLDGQEATVIGVMPDGFEFLSPARYWTASRWSEATMRSPSRMLGVAARLKPEVTLQQAQAEMTDLAANLGREFPQTNKGWTIRLESIYDSYTWFARGRLLLLQGVVALVLLIACANVAGLLLAQASARQQEFAMRLALGSSRRRLMRQLFTESLLLSCIGCAFGVAIAVAGLRAFMAQDPMSWLPRAGGIALDRSVLAFTVLVTAASGIVVGLLPSWTVSRAELSPAIKRTQPFGRISQQQLRGLLVAGQVAVALVLLVGAGLLVNTLVRLNLNRPGISPDNLLAFQLRLNLTEMVTPTGRDAGGFFTMKFSPRVSQVFSQIQERLSAVPGVQSVAAAIVPPSRPAPFRFPVAAAGKAPTSDGTEPAAWFPVSPDYFRTLGIAVRRGREFATADTLASTPVAIVNETLARRLWPGEDPIGREMTIEFVNDQPRQVVGVVADVRENSRQREFAPHVFVPDAQLPLASRGWFQAPRITMTFLVRTVADPLPLVDDFRSAVAEIYRGQPIYNVATMEEVMAEELTSSRQYMLLLGVFAGVAAVLALVGISGLVAYGVGQRTHEIGIRRALGASAGAVLKLVLRQGLILTAIGIIVGVVVSLGATQVLETLLWGVSPTDPITFTFVAVGLVTAALLACYMPARRALTIDPTIALHAE